jgi:hypothetical protein
MEIKRRDFLKIAGGAAVGSAALAGFPNQKTGTKFDPLNEKGIHPIVEKDHPYIFVDFCMQIWPDAQFQDAHRYGVTANGVTAWDPHSDLDQALEGRMFPASSAEITCAYLTEFGNKFKLANEEECHEPTIHPAFHRS